MVSKEVSVGQGGAAQWGQHPYGLRGGRSRQQKTAPEQGPLGPVFQTVPHLPASHQPGFHPPLCHFSRGLAPWRTIRGMETYQIQEGAVLYYLTFTVIEWLPVFVAEEPCKILTDSLNYCHHHKSLRINAFVLMPTHAHVMLFDADFDNDRLRHTVRDMRQFTGRQLADYSEKHLPAAFAQVMQGTARTDRARQFWQQSKHGVAIWTAEFWQTKVRYIHDNPVRKGLVWEATAWRFSSAAYWLLDPPGETDVILTEVVW